MSTNTGSAPEIAEINVRPAQAAVGGFLMGLANIVPGISGGTMLLATGIYPDFILAISELTRLKFRFRSILLLTFVGGAAALAILALAGPTKNLVVAQRWIMYSLFIGLTLGGLPIVWRLAKPLTPAVVFGALGGILFMGWMAFGTAAASGDGGPNFVLLFVAGIAGASAMILPGISGSYLLLLLGQYVPILSAIDKLKQAVAGGSLDVRLVQEALTVVIPVGLGVVAGIVGVSNLLRWLLDRYRPATLGLLLGLLLGAVFGLWPFQKAVAPAIGSTVRGETVTAENRNEIDPEDWPTESFTPTGSQIGLSAGLVLIGFGITTAIGYLDRESRGI